MKSALATITVSALALFVAPLRRVRAPRQASRSQPALPAAAPAARRMDAATYAAMQAEAERIAA
jgi:hypothetical protein